MTALLLVALLSAAPRAEVQMLSGETVAGSLAELSAERLALDASSGRVELELSRVGQIVPAGQTPPAPPAPAAWADLVDGSSVGVADVAIADGKAKLTLPDNTPLELPLRDLSAVRLQPLADSLRADWAKLAESGPAADLLVIRKGDSLEDHRGILHGLTAATVPFEVDGETLPVKREKVFGLICHQPAGRNLPEAICHVVQRDGTVWDTRSLRLDGDQLQWTTPLGVERKLPFAALAKIDLSEGKVVYLSDLKPESQEWVPFIGTRKDVPSRALFFGPRWNQSLRAGPLELDGKSYAKGLAMHSRTTLVYRLPGRFHRLKAVAGIDDRVRPRGNVRLIVRGDDQVLLETTVAGTEPPRPLDVDLNGVRRLTILVDFGEDLDVADHLDLCDPQVLK